MASGSLNAINLNGIIGPDSSECGVLNDGLFTSATDQGPSVACNINTNCPSALEIRIEPLKKVATGKFRVKSPPRIKFTSYCRNVPLANLTPYNPNEMYLKGNMDIPYEKADNYYRLILAYRDRKGCPDVTSIVFTPNDIKKCAARSVIGNQEVYILYVPIANDMAEVRSIPCKTAVSDAPQAYYTSFINDTYNCKNLHMCSINAHKVDNPPNTAHPSFKIENTTAYAFTPNLLHPNQTQSRGGASGTASANTFEEITNITSYELQQAFHNFTTSGVDRLSTAVSSDMLFNVNHSLDSTSSSANSAFFNGSLVTRVPTTDDLQRAAFFMGTQAKHTSCVSYVRLTFSFRTIGDLITDYDNSVKNGTAHGKSPSDNPDHTQTYLTIEEKIQILYNNVGHIYFAQSNASDTSALIDSVKLTQITDSSRVTDDLAAIDIDVLDTLGQAAEFNKIAAATNTDVSYDVIAPDYLSMQDYGTIRGKVVYSKPSINTAAVYMNSILVKRSTVTTLHTGLEARVVLCDWMKSMKEGNNVLIRGVLPFSTSYHAYLVICALNPVNLSLVNALNTRFNQPYDCGKNLSPLNYTYPANVGGGMGGLTFRDAVINGLASLIGGGNIPNNGAASYTHIKSQLNSGSIISYYKYIPALQRLNAFIGVSPKSSICRSVADAYSILYNKYYTNLSTARHTSTKTNDFDIMDTYPSLDQSEKQTIAAVTANCVTLSSTSETSTKAEGPIIFLSIDNLLGIMYKITGYDYSNWFKDDIVKLLLSMIGYGAPDSLDTWLNDCSNFFYGQCTDANFNNYLKAQNNIIVSSWWIGANERYRSEATKSDLGRGTTLTEAYIKSSIRLAMLVALGVPNPATSTYFSQGWSEKSFFMRHCPSSTLDNRNAPVISLGNADIYDAPEDNPTFTDKSVHNILDQRLNITPCALCIRWIPHVKSAREFITVRQKYQETMSCVYAFAFALYSWSNQPFNSSIEFPNIRNDIISNNAASTDYISVRLPNIIKYCPDIFLSFDEKYHAFVTQATLPATTITNTESLTAQNNLIDVVSANAKGSNPAKLAEFLRSSVNAFRTSYTTLTSARTPNSAQAGTKGLFDRAMDDIRAMGSDHDKYIENSSTSYQGSAVSIPYSDFLNLALSCNVLSLTPDHFTLVPASIFSMRTIPNQPSNQAICVFILIGLKCFNLNQIMVKVTDTQPLTGGGNSEYVLAENNMFCTAQFEGDEDNLKRFVAGVSGSNSPTIAVVKGMYPQKCFQLLCEVFYLAQNCGNTNLTHLINNSFKSIILPLHDAEIPYQYYPNDANLAFIKRYRSDMSISFQNNSDPIKVCQDVKAYMFSTNASPIGIDVTAANNAYESCVGRAASAPPYPSTGDVGVRMLLSQ